MLLDMMNPIREIVRKAGGPREVAAALAESDCPVGEWAVFKWYRSGIPEEHWPVIITLSGSTVQEIFDANAAARKLASRKSRRGNGSHGAVAA